MRTAYSTLTALCAALCLQVGAQAQAAESQTLVQLDLRTYADTSVLVSEQVNLSAKLQTEFSGDWGPTRWRAQIHGRLDQRDSERSRADIRELALEYFNGAWLFKIGISQAFWGVTESQHLVDVINQYDFAEDPEGNEKLGQPMVQVSFSQDWGTLDLYTLPGFRERTYSGQDSRLRSSIVVDDSDPVYRKGADRDSIDWALRYSHTLGDLDLGLSYFTGVSRDPLFDFDAASRQLIAATANPFALNLDQLSLQPVYENMQQFGIDMLWLSGDWQWKLEALRRRRADSGYSAAVVGFERTFIGAFGGREDLALVLEYNYDQRRKQAPFLTLQDDYFIGARVNLNNPSSTHFIAGVFWDPGQREAAFKLDLSHRYNQSMVIELQCRWFWTRQSLKGRTWGDFLQVRNSLGTDNTLAGVAQDGYVQLSFNYRF